MHVNVYYPTVELRAVRQDGMALEFCKNKDETLCLEAITQNPLAIQFAEHQSDKLCIQALKGDSQSLGLVKSRLKRLRVCGKYYVGRFAGLFSDGNDY
jgi:hypothetical protein